MSGGPGGRGVRAVRFMIELMMAVVMRHTVNTQAGGLIRREEGRLEVA